MIAIWFIKATKRYRWRCLSKKPKLLSISPIHYFEISRWMFRKVEVTIPKCQIYHLQSKPLLQIMRSYYSEKKNLTAIWFIKATKRYRWRRLSKKPKLLSISPIHYSELLRLLFRKVEVTIPKCQNYYLQSKPLLQIRRSYYSEKTKTWSLFDL